MTVNITENDWTIPPKLLSAEFASSGTSLIIQFDGRTSGRGTIKCSDLLRGVVLDATPWCSGARPTMGANQALGHRVTEKGCSWISPYQLSIRLGSGFELRPGNYLQLRDNVLRSTTRSRLWTTNTTVRVVAKDVVRPVSRVTSRSGSQVSSCSILSLDATGSYGGGGRPLKFQWHVTSSSPEALTSILLGNVTATSGSKLDLSPDLFLGGRKYLFTVNVRNEWHPNYESNASVSVRVASGSVPKVGVVGGGRTTLSLDTLRGDTFSIKGEWSIDQCPGSSVIERFGPPSWHVISVQGAASDLVVDCNSGSSTSGGVTLASGVSPYAPEQLACVTNPTLFLGKYRRIPHTRSNALSLPKSALVAGTTFTLGLSVHILNEPFRNNTAIFLLTVGRSSLVASIKGSEEASIPRDRTLFLDASISFDPDNTTEQFGYQWSCETMIFPPAADNVCSNGTLSSFGSTSTLLLPAGTFPVGEIVTLTVNVTTSDGTSRWSTRSVKREIVAGSPPEVSIEVKGTIESVDPITGAMRINAGSAPTFVASVLRSTGSVQYEWSLVNDDASYAQIDIPSSVWTTPTYLSKVRLKPWTLAPPSTYKFRLISTDISGTPGASTVTLQVNAPPSSGSLSSSPPIGFSFDTKFILEANGWEDDDLPLRYGFSDLGSSSSSSSSRSVLKAPAREPTFVTMLGTGSNRTVELNVLDSYGAISTTLVSVWVRTRILSSKETENEVTNLMESLTSSIHNGETTSVLEDTSTLFAAIGMLNENKVEETVAASSSSSSSAGSAETGSTTAESEESDARAQKNATRARTAFRAAILEQTSAALDVISSGGEMDESTSLLVLAAVQGVTSAPKESDVNLRMQGLNLTRNVLQQVKNGGVKVSQNTMDLVIGSMGNTLDGLSTAVAAERPVDNNGNASSTSTGSTTDSDSITTENVDANSKLVTDTIKATLNVLKDAIMVDAVAGEEPLQVVGKDLSVTVQKVPKRSNETNTSSQPTHRVSLGVVGGESTDTGVEPPGFDIPSGALPFDDDVEVLATSFTSNIYDTTKTAAGTIGLSLSKSGENMPVNNLGSGNEIIVGFPITVEFGVLPVPAYWNGTQWSLEGLVQRNSTDEQGGSRYLTFASSHLTDFSATTIVDPTTFILAANETAVEEMLNVILGGTGSIIGIQSVPTSKINDVWSEGSTSDVDKIETIGRLMSHISPLAVPNVVGDSVKKRPDMAAQVASRAVEAAPHLALEITLQAVDQGYTTPTTPAGAKAAVLSVVNMVRNTSKTTYWTTTPLATLFQAVSASNPTLRNTMVETVQSLSTSAQTQTTIAGQAASISLPGGAATLDIPSNANSNSVAVSVREYECGLVSTDVALLGRPCIGIAPHEFPSVVRLTYAVAPGATSCVKASDELSNDWHAIPKEEDGTGQGTCVILNGEAHVLAKKYSVFSFQVGSSSLAFFGDVPAGPVTYARDPSTGYLTRRGPPAGLLRDRALRTLPEVQYKVPNGTYEEVGESTLLGFAVQPNVTQYPTSKGIFFSTGSSIRRVVELGAVVSSRGEMVVSGVTTVTIRGHSLGLRLTDVAMILIKGTVCSSVFYVSDKEVGCVSGHVDVTTATRCV